MSIPRPLPQNALQTPPKSPRTRRQLLRESEESSGELSIEDYLYRTDPFRSTTASICYPLPVVRAATLLNNEIIHRLQNLIPQIRTKIDIIIQDPFTIDIYDVFKPDYPDFQNRMPTLLVEIHEGSGKSDRWSDLRNTIQDFLHQSNLNIVDVEIIDFS